MKKISLFLFLFLIIIFFLLTAVLLIVSDKIFVVFSPVEVINTLPADQSLEISLDSVLEITFSKPIKRREIKASVYPEVYGEWDFKDSLIENHLYKTLVFTPAIGFEPDVNYRVVLENIQGFGFNKTNSFEFSFQTEKQSIIEEEILKEKPEVVILDIPLDWQDQALSCEAASLKMALAGKGIIVSENEIMEKIGYDTALRTADVWGDPYEKYVGDIDGKMCKTGYGVYWEPVAKAANFWRPAEAFSNWGIEDLTKEISLGNPVIFWGALPTGSLTDCSWQTSEGKYIKAFKETHVRLVVGFIGPEKNPSQIIINDPLAGQIYWLASFFLNNWKTFDYSGVVVR